MLRLTFTLLAVMFLSKSALAQSLNKERETVDFFMAYCAQTLDDFKTVRASAKVFDWQPLTDVQLQMGAPADPRASLEGWLAKKKNGMIFLLGLSTTPDAKACSVGNLDFNPNELTSELQSMAILKDHTSENALGQREQSWTADLHGNPILIRLISSSRDDELGGSLQAATIKRK